MDTFGPSFAGTHVVPVTADGVQRLDVPRLRHPVASTDAGLPVQRLRRGRTGRARRHRRTRRRVTSRPDMPPAKGPRPQTGLISTILRRVRRGSRDVIETAVSQLFDAAVRHPQGVAAGASIASMISRDWPERRPATSACTAIAACCMRRCGWAASPCSTTRISRGCGWSPRC